MEGIAVMILYLVIGFFKNRKDKIKRKKIKEGPDWDPEKKTGPDNSINNILTGTTLFSGHKTFTGTIDISSGILRGPSNFYIDPSPYGISGETGTAGRVIIRGDLQVDGSQTIVNSRQVDISDKTILLASGSNNITEADGAGIEIHNNIVDKFVKYL